MRTYAAWTILPSLCIAFLGGCPAPVDPDFEPPDDTVLFRDDFDSDTFDADWEISADDSSALTLEERPGFLTVTVGPSQNGSPENRLALLVRDVEGDFVLETRMVFDPMADRHIAGLVIRGDDDRRVSFGLLSASGARGSFRGVVPVVDEPRTLDLDQTVLAYEESEVVLRIRRERDVFELSYSRDGQTFTRVGTVTTNLSDVVRVGVGAATSEDCIADCTDLVPAEFDYFEISRVE